MRFVTLTIFSLIFKVYAGALGYETSSYCKKYDCQGKKRLKLKKGKYEFIGIKFFDNEKLEGKPALEIKKEGFFEGERLLCSPAHHHPWVSVKVDDADHGRGLFANQAYDKYVTTPKEHGKTNVEAVCLEEPISYKNGEFKIFLTRPAHAGEGIFHSKRGDKSLYFKLNSKNHGGVAEWKEEDKSHIKACKDFLKANKEKVLAIFTEVDEVLKAYDKDGTILKEKLIKAVRKNKFGGHPSFLASHSMCAMVEQIGYKGMDYQKCDELGGLREMSEKEFYGMFIDSVVRNLVPRAKDVIKELSKEDSCYEHNYPNPEFVVFEVNNVQYHFITDKSTGKIEYDFSYPVRL